MLLKVKDIDLSSGGPLIAILNYKDAEKLDLHALDRIKIKKNKKEITAAINISETKKAVKQGEIGLFEEVLDLLKPKKGSKVRIYPEKYPRSIDFIKKKLQGKRLKKEEINEIIKDLVTNKLTEVEQTYFVSACYPNKLSEEETLALINAIVKNGYQLNINKKIIADKHSVSGVPNNRTTLIIVPILAAAGITIPKSSSRAITSASGTADTMEALAQVSFHKKELEKIIKKTKGFIVWGGGINLASADDKLIRLRYKLRLDPEGILLSSILAKKAAVKANHVLIEIITGKQVKVKTMKQAKHLKKRFESLAKKLKMKIKVVINKADQPVGNGIGSNLEARDILYILRRDPRAPKDLEKKALKLSVILMKLVGIKNAEKKAKEILESGLAYKKMKEIIKAQKGNPNIKPQDLKLGEYHFTIKANKTKKIKKIDTKKIVKIARIAGSLKNKEVGVYLNVKLNQKIKKGQPLFTIYSNNKQKLEYTKTFINGVVA